MPTKDEQLEEERLKMEALLEDGWDIAGYSVCMMAGGTLAHNILMQNDINVKTITIVTSNKGELSRDSHTFVPTPEKKKGWLG